jgi:hypothetical protein
MVLSSHTVPQNYLSRFQSFHHPHYPKTHAATAAAAKHATRVGVKSKRVPFETA